MLPRQILCSNIARLTTCSIHNFQYTRAYITPLLQQSTYGFAVTSKSIARAQAAVQSAKKATVRAKAKQTAAEKRLKQLQQKAVTQKKQKQQAAQKQKAAQKKRAAAAKRRKALAERRRQAAALTKRHKRAQKAQKAAAAQAAKKAAQLRASEQQLLKVFPDPTKPRRPCSSYALYFQDWLQRNAVQLRPDNLASSSKQAAEEWKNLDSATKSRYVERGHELNEEYRVAKAAYDETGNREAWLNQARQLRESRPARTGYAVFLQQKWRSAGGGVPATGRVKVFANEWNSLTVEQKQPYNEQAANQYQQWKSHVQSFYE